MMNNVYEFLFTCRETLFRPRELIIRTKVTRLCKPERSKTLVERAPVSAYSTQYYK